MKRVNWSDKILTVRSLEVLEGIESPDLSFIKARATESHVKSGVTDVTISGMVNLYEFSINGSTSWHSTFSYGDLYMRMSTDNGATWGSAIRIVGETGATGPWINYVFGKSNSSTTYPTWSATGSYPNGTWLDAPPVLGAGEYCWYTKATYSGETRTGNWSTPVRMTGEKGETGATGQTGQTGAQGDPAPKYLGRYNASNPASYSNGDWWLVYDTNDSPIQRGVWYSNAGTPARITTSSTADLRGKMASAIMDIAWCETNGNGVAADYGFDTFFKSLAAISIFVNDLHAVNAEFFGTITSDPLSTTNIVTIDAHSAWGTSYSGITFNAYYAALPRKKIAAAGTYNGTAYASIRNTGYSIEFYTSPETGNTLLGSVYRIDPTTSKNVASDAISIPATVVTQTLTPETAGTYDIGTSAKPYRMAYNLVRKPYALVKHSSITEADMFAWLQDKFEYAGLTQDANEEICCSGYDATDDVNFVYVVWYSATEFRIYGGHVSGCRYVTYLASGTGSDATHDVLFYM